MKSACIALTTIMVLGFTARAETPAARECRINGGRLWAVTVSSTSDTSLCLFGSAAVGATEFAEYKLGNGVGLSLKAFMNQTAEHNATGFCDVVGAAYHTATDSKGKTWELCSFPDTSTIELQTLARGANNSKNANLVRALR